MEMNPKCWQSNIQLQLYIALTTHQRAWCPWLLLFDNNQSTNKEWISQIAASIVQALVENTHNNKMQLSA